MNKEICLNIEGLGIIMYSDFAVAHIEERTDYFSQNYNTSKQVIEHIYNGTIVGFCTSSSGKFILKLKKEEPKKEELCLFEFKIKLGIEVRDERICIRDLYDLIDWKNESSKNNIVEMENGFYKIYICGNVPSTGILGDNQEIYVYFQKVARMPKLNYDGVPIFCE